MTVISTDFPQNLSDDMPEESDPIAHNGKQNVLVYHTRQNLLKFPQGVLLNVDEANRNVFIFSECNISDVMKGESNLVMLPSIDDFYV